MESQIIKKKDLEQIYGVACKDWKLKIESYASRDLFNDEVKLSGDEIEEMFSVSNAEQKKILDKFFVREKIVMDVVKTFDDACKVCGIDVRKFPDVYSKDTKAYEKLKIIVKALNDGWIPNWENSKECKFYPYFKASPFGFADAFYVTWNTSSSTGSRLCFKSKELAEYAGKQFTEIYEDFII